MNPSNLPTWAKLTIGAVIVAGNAVLPYLTKANTLSPTAHAVIMGVAAVWLLVTNTFQPPTPPAKPPSTSGLGPFATMLCLVLGVTGCSWFSSPQGASGTGLAAKDVVCIVAHDAEPIAQIVQDCNLVGDVANIVSSIVDQAHANERHAATAACLPYDAGAPIKPFVDAGAGK